MIKSSSKTMTVAVAALALCMAAGSAFAQDRRDDRGPQRFQPPQQHQPQFQQRHGQFDHRGGPGYRGDRQDFRPGREMDRRVAGVVVFLEELVAELISFEDLHDGSDVTVADGVTKGGECGVYGGQVQWPELDREKS